MKKFLLVATAAALAAASSAVLAQTVADNDIALTDPSGWVEETLPASTAIAEWLSGMSERTKTIGASGLTLGGLRIASIADQTIGGLGTLTLGTNGIDMSSAGGNFIIDTNLATSVAQAWKVSTGRTLTVGTLDAHTLALGGNLSITNGTGAWSTTVINSDITGTGHIFVGANNSSSAAASTYTEVHLNGKNAFIGNVYMSGNSRLVLGSGDALGGSAGALYFTTGSTSHQIASQPMYITTAADAGDLSFDNPLIQSANTAYMYFEGQNSIAFNNGFTVGNGSSSYFVSNITGKNAETGKDNALTLGGNVGIGQNVVFAGSGRIVIAGTLGNNVGVANGFHMHVGYPNSYTDTDSLKGKSTVLQIASGATCTMRTAEVHIGATLIVDGNYVNNESGSNLVVANGAALGGRGTITLQTVTVASGATLGGGLTINANSIALNNTSFKFNAGEVKTLKGNLTWGGNIALDLTGKAEDWVFGEDVFSLLFDLRGVTGTYAGANVTSSNTITSTEFDLAQVLEDAEMELGDLKIVYYGGLGTSSAEYDEMFKGVRGIYLLGATAIPEPSTWLLLGAGAAVLVVFRRRALRRNQIVLDAFLILGLN